VGRRAATSSRACQYNIPSLLTYHVTNLQKARSVVSLTTATRNWAIQGTHRFKSERNCSRSASVSSDVSARTIHTLPTWLYLTSWPRSLGMPSRMSGKQNCSMQRTLSLRVVGWVVELKSLVGSSSRALSISACITMGLRML
jgi:hypothetical protein